MKRASFFLAFICLALFSFGQANAQGGSVTIDHVDGLAFGSTTQLECGNPVEIFFRMTNPAGDFGITGSANGFRLYSPDGATWSPGLYIDTTTTPFSTTIDTTFYGQFIDPSDPQFVWTGGDGATTFSIYDGGIFVNTFSEDGMMADTVGFAGFVQQTGFGLFPGFDFVSYSILIADIPCADTGLTICVDSSYYPPSGVWLWADGSSYPPAWQGNTCWEIFKTPNLAPVIDCQGIGSQVNFNHCDPVVINLSATDADGPAPITWTTDGGTIQNDDGTGNAELLFTAPAGSLSGCQTVTVTATDGGGAFSECTFDLCWTNNAPTCTDAGSVVRVATSTDQSQSAQNGISASDPDACDNVTYSAGANLDGAVGAWSVDPNTGVVTFSPQKPEDDDATFCFEVIASDGELADTCVACFEAVGVEPFGLVIEKTHGSIQGTHETVDVYFNAGSVEIGGFDILIAYDASALAFQKAIPGDYYFDPCYWEYFQYRFSAFGNCGSICPSGKLRVTGIAETNNGPAHPMCFGVAAGDILFSLDFLVTDDRTLECTYVPIRFCWFDCGDNTLSSITGDSLFISATVSEYDLGGEITDFNFAGGYPTYTGAQDSDCFTGNETKVPFRFIDFFNGGVDIACAESLDARGDINLNEIPNEIADAVLFSRYFIYGLGVFTINMDGQIAATDVNADGLALSVADLVYQIRIIVGDANPFPKLNPVEVNYTVSNGTIAVDSKIGAAFVEVDGMVEPTNLSDLEMKYAYNAESNTTRILVFSMDKGEVIEGDFLQVNGNVLNIEMATYEGTPVVASKLPTNFALNQNYPNPFNPSTNISFNLPVASDVSLTIHNVTGQKVAEFNGTYEAGEHVIEWDAAQFASGIYFYKLSTDRFTDTKRMVLVK